MGEIMRNRAAFMTEPDHMEIRNIAVPEPSEEEVLVKLEYVGICGSDVHYFHDGRCGDFVVDGEFILGHECAGTIIKTGKHVKKIKVGDRVALEPGITCGQCEFCRKGLYNLCPDVKFLATPPVQGCFMNYMTFPENMCFVLPENVSAKEGALVEPLSVGMHAANQGNVGVGDHVVILGSGCIGLMTMLACKAHGATDITVIDVLPNRLEKAKELGATRVINGKKEDAVKAINELTGGMGVDKVFETAGSAVTTAQTAYLVKNGGTVVLVGMAANPKITYDFGPIMAKEAEIKTIFRYRNIYPSAIEAIAQGMIPVAAIVSDEFVFEDIEEAFRKNVEEKDTVVKAVVKMTE